MKKKLVAFLVLSFDLAASIVLADVNGGETSITPNNFGNMIVFSILALLIILCIYGVYLSRKKKIVIFANYTDILVTVSIPISGWLFFELLGKPGLNEPLLLCLALLPAFCIFLLMCWSTFLYNTSINSGIFGFLLALYTKIFLFCAFCILLFMYFFSSRKKGQTRASYKKENKVYLAGVAGLLTYLGTSDRRFVSLRNYCSGK